MNDKLSVTLLGRPGCHLCDAVADELDDLRRELPLDITVIDITADPALHAELWAQIPVVRVAGTELRAPISSAKLAAAIARAVRANMLDKR